MKIGILTWHYYLNFGSALQAYALKRLLESCSDNEKYNVSIINYRNPEHGNPSKLKNACRLLASYVFSKKGIVLGRHITYPFLRFHKDYLKLGKSFTSSERLIKVSKKYDVIVCGSDQIWAPSVFNPIYLLDFVSNRTRKVSYAASIGLDYIPEELVVQYNELLKSFSAISVREEKGKELLEERCGIISSVVLDPTLMVDINEWKKLERRPTDISFDFEKPFLFCYFLNANNTYKKSVIDYAQRNGLQIVGYSLNPKDSSYIYDIKQWIGPREFLWILGRADVVVTDSYHGTIFSLLNQKQFVTFKRFSDQDPICQNSRINQLVSYFGINERVVTGDVDTIEIAMINYDEINKKLGDLRKESYEFIKGSLGE